MGFDLFKTARNTAKRAVSSISSTARSTASRINPVSRVFASGFKNTGKYMDFAKGTFNPLYKGFTGVLKPVGKLGSGLAKVPGTLLGRVAYNLKAAIGFLLGTGSKGASDLLTNLNPLTAFKKGIISPIKIIVIGGVVILVVGGVSYIIYRGYKHYESKKQKKITNALTTAEAVKKLTTT